MRGLGARIIQAGRGSPAGRQEEGPLVGGARTVARRLMAGRPSTSPTVGG